ncbi:hypothetical protein Acsp03_64300 [Actinomadura sp. NBRC 104412]|uniref:hypothetical protein n=1 Tax=Actinomadura sp. NBRC 104412 TaxID=3032203 RepID=UPI0024A09150|nr:hypothetical protein [Actinomadura sp. NBRC 104412]GLZ08964.1 hypothetical protein Acsp03_64300 [Actinomadura sp. NBRC 104412]
MTHNPSPDQLDARFNIGLIDAVFSALESHGYHRPDGPDDERHMAIGRAVGLLGQLVKAYEGQDDER